MRVLAFQSGSQRYLVRLEAVRAVVRLRGLRRLPGSGGALLGVIDVQETSVAIYDTRPLREAEAGEAASGDVLVLAAGWPEHAVGVACDEALGLMEVADADALTDARPQGLPDYVESLLRVDGLMMPLVDAVGLAEATAVTH